MEILALVIGFIIALVFVKNIGGGFITFFIVWTIAIMLSGIVMALFGLFFGGFLFAAVIVAFIWIVKKIIVG